MSKLVIVDVAMATLKEIITVYWSEKKKLKSIRSMTLMKVIKNYCGGSIEDVNLAD